VRYAISVFCDPEHDTVIIPPKTLAYPLRNPSGGGGLADRLWLGLVSTGVGDSSTMLATVR
jgi:hypothetical protein